jgi:hypothetical protein
MARWASNEAHTAAEFSVRHMMITFVRGTSRNLQGTLEFDPDHPEEAWVETSIDAATLRRHEDRVHGYHADQPTRLRRGWNAELRDPASWWATTSSSPSTWRPSGPMTHGPRER